MFLQCNYKNFTTDFCLPEFCNSSYNSSYNSDMLSIIHTEFWFLNFSVWREHWESYCGRDHRDLKGGVAMAGQSADIQETFVRRICHNPVLDPHCSTLCWKVSVLPLNENASHLIVLWWTMCNELWWTSHVDIQMQGNGPCSLDIWLKVRCCIQREILWDELWCTTLIQKQMRMILLWWS